MQNVKEISTIVAVNGTDIRETGEYIYEIHFHKMMIMENAK